MANQEWIIGMSKLTTFQRLIKDNNLDYIIFHKELLLPHEDLSDLDLLRKSPLVKKVWEDERVSIFEIK